MWARWSDILFSWKKFTRKHGRHGQTLKIYFSRTNWFFLTKTWGIIRELLFYPKHIFTDFWNNGKWKKQNVAQIQLPVTCGTCNTLHFELIRAVITVVVNNVPPAFNNLNIIQFQTVLVKASASQKQPADRHHAVVPKWLICAIFICPLLVTLKVCKNMFWIEWQLANNTSSFCKKKPIRSGEINLQTLAMAAMFAREFFSSKQHVRPSRPHSSQNTFTYGIEIK